MQRLVGGLISFGLVLGLAGCKTPPATPPDTLATWVDQEMTQERLVRDLNSLIQADPTFDFQDFYPNSLDVLHLDHW